MQRAFTNPEENHTSWYILVQEYFKSGSHLESIISSASEVAVLRRAMTFDISATTPVWIQVSPNEPGYLSPQVSQHGLDQSERLP